MLCGNGDWGLGHGYVMGLAYVQTTIIAVNPLIPLVDLA